MQRTLTRVFMYILLFRMLCFPHKQYLTIITLKPWTCRKQDGVKYKVSVRRVMERDVQRRKDSIRFLNNV